MILYYAIDLISLFLSLSRSRSIARPFIFSISLGRATVSTPKSHIGPRAFTTRTHHVRARFRQRAFSAADNITA
jgi:hypothetical protein